MNQAHHSKSCGRRTSRWFLSVSIPGNTIQRFSCFQKCVFSQPAARYLEAVEESSPGTCLCLEHHGAILPWHVFVGIKLYLGGSTVS